MKARRTDGGIHKNKPFRSGGPTLTREQREQRKMKQQQVNQPAGGTPRSNFKVRNMTIFKLNVLFLFCSFLIVILIYFQFLRIYHI